MDFNVVYNIRTIKYIYEKMPKMQIFHMLHAINVHQTILRHAVYYLNIKCVNISQYFLRGHYLYL